MNPEFQAFLLGTWSNKSQAQSNPTGFRQVTLHWTRKIGRGQGYFHGAYHYRNEPDPYLEVRKKLIMNSETEVVLEHFGGTYSNWKRVPACDMTLKWDGSKWYGEFDTGSITAELHLYGNKLFTKDKSVDEDGKVIWGDDKLYKFVRL